MSIQAILFVALAAVSCCSGHPPTPNSLKPQLEKASGNHSVIASDCVAVVARQDIHSILRMRMRHLRSGGVSLSPPSAPPPYVKPDNNTKTNATLHNSHPSPKIYSWIPAFQDVVTPIFRAVILILTLFNINITWRIHGEWRTLSVLLLF